MLGAAEWRPQRANFAKRAICEARARLWRRQLRKSPRFAGGGHKGRGAHSFGPSFRAPRPTARSRQDRPTWPPPRRPQHGRSLSVKSFRRKCKKFPPHTVQVLARAQRVRPPAPRQTELPISRSNPVGAAGSLSAVAPPAPDVVVRIKFLLCRSKLRKMGILRNSPPINLKISNFCRFGVLFVLVVPILIEYGCAFILGNIVGRLISFSAVVVIISDTGCP